MASKSEKNSTTTITMGGVPIKFPFASPYTSQKQLMSKCVTALKNKQNALLESPTGSGKSLAILCSVLAWHKYMFSSIHLNTKTTSTSTAESNEYESKQQKPPKIIFTSRTHGQLQQLIAEFRRTAYSDCFQMVVLGSRKSLCINDKIQPLYDRNDQCKKALDLKDCRFNRNKGYIDRFKSNSKFSKGQIFDIEDLVSEGKKMGCCAYYGSRALLERANLIFCPYNYILDPVIRKQMGINTKNAIIIIDEAHNVEDVCRSALTKSYTLEDVTLCIEELDRLMNESNGLNGTCKLPENVWESVSEIKELFIMIKDWMNEQNETFSIEDYKNQRNVYPHPDTGKNKINKILKKHIEYDQNAKDKYFENAKQIFGYFHEMKKESNDSTDSLLKIPQIFNQKVAVIIEYFVQILLPNMLENEKEFTIAFLPRLEENKRKRCKEKRVYLHFWCLSPSVAFKQMSENTHSVILTSGTLSPLNAMEYELQCNFNQKLVADHVIEKGQVLITAIDRGINGNQLKMVYNNVKNESLQDDVGQSLLNLFDNIPKGIVVFFPSYATMQLMVERWQKNKTFASMNKIKKIYIEPRGSDEEATQSFMEAIESFGRDCGNIKYLDKYWRSKKGKKELKKLKKAKEKEVNKSKNGILQYLNKDYSFCPSQQNGGNEHEIKCQSEDQDIDVLTPPNSSKKGAVFFGVCRGKISEGIDFSDGMSRAVILIGIPYPNQKDHLIHFKKKFNSKQAQMEKYKHSMNGRNDSFFVLDGNAWYNREAFRALNQALGRCIRHKYDYGCIIFLESRFYGNSNYSQKNVQNLSKWVRPFIKSSLSINNAIRDLIRPYFEYMDKNPPKQTKIDQTKWIPPFISFDQQQRRQSEKTNVFGTKYQSMSPPIYEQNTMHHNNIGNLQKFAYSKSSSSQIRKRKFDEIENENFDSINMKKMKLQSNERKNVINANCIQCSKCSALALHDKFELVSLPGPGGVMKQFHLTKNEHPLPKQTANDCIWSSQLELCCLSEFCRACNMRIGFHVVGAMTQKKLKYMKRILFLASQTKLHRI